jgi:hypothetical protein
MSHKALNCGRQTGLDFGRPAVPLQGVYYCLLCSVLHTTSLMWSGCIAQMCTRCFVWGVHRWTYLEQVDMTHRSADSLCTLWELWVRIAKAAPKPGTELVITEL